MHVGGVHISLVGGRRACSPPLCAVLDVCLPKPPRKKKPAVCGSTEEDPNAVKGPNIASKEEEQEPEQEKQEQEEEVETQKRATINFGYIP